MRDMMGLMKQAQQMQAKLAEAQAEIERTEVEGVSGGGMVKLRMSAKGDLKAIAVDPTLMKADEKDILEDLIMAAHADARRKADAIMADRMKSATAGIPLPPGMKLPF